MNRLYFFIFSLIIFSCAQPDNSSSSDEDASINIDFGIQGSSANSSALSANSSFRSSNTGIDADEDIVLEISFLNEAEETELIYKFYSPGSKTILLPKAEYIVSSKLTRGDGQEYFTDYQDLNASQGTSMNVNLDFQNASSAVEIPEPTGNVGTSEGISLTVPDSSVTVYYTTDGTEPDLKSSKFDGSPIYFSGGDGEEITLNVMFVKGGKRIFQSQTFTFEHANLDPLDFQDAEGNTIASGVTLNTSFNVSIVSPNSGSEIWYSLDGGSWKFYSDVVNISGEGSHTLQARAEKTNYKDSPTLIRNFTIDFDKLSPPTINLTDEEYTSDVTVLLSPSTSDSAIYYSIDGSTPVFTYSESLTFNSNGDHVVKAFERKDGFDDSDIMTYNFTIEYPSTEVTLTSPSNLDNTYDSGTNITLSVSDPLAHIYYKEYGDPGSVTVFDNHYTGAFSSYGGGLYHIQAVSNTPTRGTSKVYDFYIKMRGPQETIMFGANDTYAKSVVVNSSGDVFYIGATKGNLDGESKTGTTDGFVRKLDYGFNNSWTKLFGQSGASTEAVGALTKTDDILVVLDFDDQLVLKKFDKEGNELMSLTDSNVPSVNFLTDVKVDNEDNIIIYGSATGTVNEVSTATTGSFFLAKYSSSGSPIWYKLYSFEGVEPVGHEYGYDTEVAISNSNDIYVYGFLWDNTYPWEDDDVQYLKKIDSDGNEIWSENWTQRIYDIKVDDTGNLYYAGTAWRKYTGHQFMGHTLEFSRSAFLIKRNANNESQWMVIEGGGGSGSTATGNRIGFDEYGYVYLAGSASGNLESWTVLNHRDLFLTKYDSSDGSRLSLDFLDLGNDTYPDIRAVIFDGSERTSMVGNTYTTVEGTSKVSSGRDVFITSELPRPTP